MNKKFSIGFLVLVALFSVFTGCKKYEEGPMISFRDKRARVANTWTFDKVTIGGQDATGSVNQDSVKFILNFHRAGWYGLGMVTKEGKPIPQNTMNAYINNNNSVAGSSVLSVFSTGGRWSLNDKKSNMMDIARHDLSQASDSIRVVSYEVLKLKNKEMKLKGKDKVSGNDIVIELKQLD